MTTPAARRAKLVFDDAIASFGRVGYRVSSRPSELLARLEAPGREPALLLRMDRQGRIFGGTYALEVTTAEPVLPATAGLSARGRGVVRMKGVAFRPHRSDAAGEALAERLASDDRLVGALSNVHFERIRVEPGGRPVIRHMGGSLVWMLFPPLVRGVPLVDDQVLATVAALGAFARVGESI